MHDWFSIILNIMCGNMGHFHELLDILGIVKNVIMHDFNIHLPIWSKMFVVDTIWMHKFMYNFSWCIAIVFAVHRILGQPNILLTSQLSRDTPAAFTTSYTNYLDIIFFCLPWAVKNCKFYLAAALLYLLQRFFRNLRICRLCWIQIDLNRSKQILTDLNRSK